MATTFSPIGGGFSEYKTRILLFLKEKQPQTISQIMRELDISYKETHRHVSELLKMKYLEKKVAKKEKHSPAYITLSEIGDKKAQIIIGFRKVEEEVMGESGKKEVDNIMRKTINKFKKIQRSKEFKDFKKQPKTE
jgi:DNA-binding MarR family transcriptional regulator